MMPCDDVHGTLWTIVDTELERGIFRGLKDVLMRKLCEDTSEHSKTNEKIFEYIKRLNVRSDACLRVLDEEHCLKVLDVSRSKCKNDEEVLVTQITSKLRSSILRLGEIKVYTTPRTMLQCISDACRLITEVTSGNITSDTLIPVLAFAIVRARLENVYLKSVFVDLFMPESIRLGEAGFTFVTFQSALNHIRAIGEKISENQFE